MLKQLIKFLSVLGALAYLGGCEPTEFSHGNYVEHLDKVTKGMTRDEVIEAWGPPTNKQIFQVQEKGWYYIGTKNEVVSFYWPKVRERRIVFVGFDKEHRVTQVTVDDGQGVREMNISDRTTPALGHDEGVMSEVFGNIGRFHMPGKH